MPDFFASELHRQRLDRVDRVAHEGARRREWVRQVLEARRSQRQKPGA